MPEADYPHYLLPQPAYRLLSSPYPEEGILVRRTEPIESLRNAEGEFLAEYLTLPNPSKKGLAAGYSTNLLGTFSLADTAWCLQRDGPLFTELDSDWSPGEEGILPSVPDDIVLLERGEWNCFWLSLQEIHNQEFEGVGNHPYRCEVRHCPTHCNYWHYQIHFMDLKEGGNGVDTADRPNQYSKVAERVRPWFLEQIKTGPLDNFPVTNPWELAWYCPTC